MNKALRAVICRMHASPAYKNVGRKETVQELYCLKAWQISKDYARSREITNEPYASLKYENTEQYPATAFTYVGVL